MPLYEFRCPTCGARFDRQVPLADVGSTIPCPCGAAARRGISRVRFRSGAEAPVPSRRDLPSSLEGVGGTREGISRFRRIEESVSRFEASHPEIVEQRRPVLSHEGGRVVYATPSSPVAPNS